MASKKALRERVLRIAAKQDYITGTSLEIIAYQYKVRMGTLLNWCERDKWGAARKQAEERREQEK